ncbi:hypothetical protein AB6E04_12965 [Vibrio amylolyticus]|uniref:hypothetical protein n=1 Tax=Vibrio amylolyticus TaxID=2847292 RepID=UPI003550E9A7
MSTKLSSILNNSYVYIFPFIFIALPVLLNEYPLWDGAVLVYGAEIGNSLVVKHWFLETGTPIIYSFHSIVYFLIRSLSLNALFIYSFLTILFLSFILFSIKNTFCDFNRGKKSESIIFSIMFVALPFWSIFLSSIMVNYALVYSMVFLSFYFLVSKKLLVSFLFFVLASDNGISYVIHLLLFVFYISNLDPITFKSEIREKCKYYFFYYLSALAMFGLMSLIFNVHGEYSEYNKIIWDNLYLFFLDKGIILKIGYFFPIFLCFLFSKSRIKYISLFILSIGLIGVFYLAGKANYIGFPVYPWFARFDVAFYLFLFLLCYHYFFTEKNLYLKALMLICYCICLFPLKYAVDYALSDNLTKLDVFYSESPQIERMKAYAFDFLGGAYFEKNYHIFNRYGEVNGVSVETLGYLDKQCNIDSEYSVLFVCDNIDMTNGYEIIKIDNDVTVSYGRLYGW